jgi:MFS family permease
VPERLPRTFWFLFAGSLLNRLGGFVVSFLALYLTARRGYSDEAAGQVVSLWGLGAVLAGPIAGHLADRVGRRPTMLAACALGATCALALGFARAPSAIGACALGLGLFGEGYRPALQAAVPDVVPPLGRNRAYGFLFWAANIGFAGAALTGGLLFELDPLLLFIADAATTLGFGLLVFLAVPETRPARAAASVERRRSGSLAVPLADRPFLAFVASHFLVVFVFLQSAVALPLDLRARGVTPERFGALMALNGLLIVALQPFAARVADRVGRWRLLRLGALLTGAGFAMNALGSTTPLFGASIVVWTLGEIALSAPVLAVIADRAPADLRGTYQGVFQLAFGGASLLAPLVGSLALARLGRAALWGGCLGLCAVAATAYLVLEPRLAPRAEESERRGTTGGLRG